jgi:hypothetical protein
VAVIRATAKDDSDMKFEVGDRVKSVLEISAFAEGIVEVVI